MEKKWRQCARDGNFTRVKKEPFPGALCTAALVFYHLKDSDQTARVMENIFENRTHKDLCGSDWFWLCRAFSEKISLNRDLMTEYLAAIVRKQNDAYRSEFIPLILKAIETSEFLWIAKESDFKASEYLKQLLGINASENENGTFAEDADLEKRKMAFSILGLSENSSPEKISREYRKLIRKFHPDYNKNENATEMFLKIQAAYETLSKN